MTSTKETEEVGQRLLRVDERGREQTSREEREAVLDEFDRSGVGPPFIGPTVTRAREGRKVRNCQLSG